MANETISRVTWTHNNMMKYTACNKDLLITTWRIYMDCWHNVPTLYEPKFYFLLYFALFTLFLAINYMIIIQKMVFKGKWFLTGKLKGL